MLRIITISVFFVLGPAGIALGFPKHVTPYGDYCREYTVYGSCREPIAHHDAIKVLEKYYGEKGYRIGAINYRGRFIEADIYRNERQVDRVILDRKTGRLRSVY